MSTLQRVPDSTDVIINQDSQCETCTCLSRDRQVTMGRIVRDATPEQEQVFVEERRRFAFSTSSKSLSRWVRTAERHKRAADIVYEVAHAAHERELARTREDIAVMRAKKDKQGLSCWNGSRTLQGEELRDFLDSELLSEYLLLSGYALECILKGCLLTKSPELIKGGEKLDKKVANHKLEQLFIDCGLSLSPLEQQVISIIVSHVEWRKYPVPERLWKMPSPVESDPTPLDIPGSPFHERKMQTLVNGLFQRGHDLADKLRESHSQADSL